MSASAGGNNLANNSGYWSGGTPLKQPGVGSPSWIATHPNYAGAPLAPYGSVTSTDPVMRGGLQPFGSVTSSPSWIAGHPGAQPATGVGSSAWISTHPNYGGGGGGQLAGGNKNGGQTTPIASWQQPVSQPAAANKSGPSGGMGY